MLPLAVDENLNAAIIRGLRRREPAIDALSVQEAGLSGASDPEILEWATTEGRLLLTHDVQTMLRFMKDRLDAHQRCCGVIEVPRSVPIGQVIDEVLLIAAASFPEEWNGRCLFLPLR